MNRQPIIQYAGDFPDRPDQASTFKTVWMYNGSGAQIASGAVCAIDSSVVTKGQGRAVKTCDGDSATEDSIACGGAVRAIPNGQWGEVQVSGRQDLVLSNGAIAIDSLLECTDGAQPGRVNIMTADPATVMIRPIARAASANTGSPGTISVFWLNPQNL